MNRIIQSVRCIDALVVLSRFRRIPVLSVLALFAVGPHFTAEAQEPTPTPPPYYLESPIRPPADFSPNGALRAVAMNAQAYVAFDYVASPTDPDSQRTPVVFKSHKEPFVVLPWPGDLNPAPTRPITLVDISDVADDGSFWVVGVYRYSNNSSRGVAWKVLANGSATMHTLENFAAPGQETDGLPRAINSSGVVVGDSLNDQVGSRGCRAARWHLPSPEPQHLSADNVCLGAAFDVNESGDFTAVGLYRDFSYSGGFFNYQPLPMVNGRSISLNGLKANRITGSYQFQDEQGFTGPFVYTVGDPRLTRLPKPTGLNGETNPDGGDAGNHINAAGDIVGTASNPPTIGNNLNPSFQVLWKRQEDGSYRVHTLRSILRQLGKDGDEYRNARLLGIAADGTILLEYFPLSGRTSRLLRPGVRPTNQPLNISTRLRVRSGDNVLIGGMIVTGSENKYVVVRALGPSLADAGVQGVLEDPVLEFYEDGRKINENDSWKAIEHHFQPGLPAAGFQPPNDREAAVLGDLAANFRYTAVVRGKNGGQGVALVEVYDLSRDTDAQLANISTRGFVESGDNVMIAGFIIGGSGAKVLIRALGPSLGDAGVPGSLSDPTLELVDSNGTTLKFNDDWQSGQPNEIPAGFAPSKPAEAVIVAAVPSGPYTAIVRGRGDSKGVGLVEVYNLN